MSEALKERIRRHEGLRLAAYRDSLGYPTQGYGHLLTEDKLASLDQFPKITLEQAEKWLDQDIAYQVRELRKDFAWFDSIDEVRQGVLIEQSFQLGENDVEDFHKMLAAVQVGDWAEASRQMLDSKWHKQTPTRCEELAQIMLTGGTYDSTIA